MHHDVHLMIENATAIVRSTLCIKMSSKWNRNAQKEASKLSHKEGDWNLAGSEGITETRTRQNRRKKRQYKSDSSESEDEESYSVEESISSTSEEDTTLENEVTEPMRVIVETASIQNLVERNMICPECQGKVEMIHETVTLATKWRIQCLNTECNFIDHSDALAAAVLHTDDVKRERSTDYAVNVLYVVGVIANGDGATEASRMLGFLGLPRPATMKGFNFAVIEDRIAPTIWKLHEEIMLENLKKEVRATVTENEYHIWQQSLDPSSPIQLDKKDYPKIRSSYDTGWNQRLSGKLYNSPSSHSFLVGAKTRLPVEGEVLSKLCSYHQSWEKKVLQSTVPEGTVCPEHYCVMNFDPSATSGSMEPFAAAKIVNRLHQKWQAAVDLICMDDDASTRTALKWSNADHMRNHNTEEVPKVEVKKKNGEIEMKERPDKGQLHGDVAEPSTTADPNHRRKILTGDLLTLALSKGDDKLTMTKMDVQRIVKNYGYMIRALPRLEESKYEEAAKAVLEHHFDNHEYCGTWCSRKRLTPEQLQQSDRYYQSKTKDAKLYHKLQDILSRFVSLERLKEVAHGMDTNVNESINNTVSYFAPKNRVYCKTRSLQNRVAFAVGVTSLGFSEYFLRLFKELGIQVTPPIRHFLEMKQKNRQKRIQKRKQTATKKARKQLKFTKLKEEEAKAIRARHKRDGTYKSGGNLQDGGFENTKKPAKGPIVCPHCGHKGHKTTRSKKCLANPSNPNYNPNLVPDAIRSAASNKDAVNEVEELERADVDQMDSLPFMDDIPGVDFERDEFHDCGTWSEDDTGNVTTYGIL
jgi:hypothetical protein